MGGSIRLVIVFGRYGALTWVRIEEKDPRLPQFLCHDQIVTFRGKAAAGSHCVRDTAASAKQVYR